MTIVDYVDLCDDEEMIVKEHNSQGQVHAAQLEVEIIDLSSEEDVTEEGSNTHGTGNAAQSATKLHRQDFGAAHGQGNAAVRTTTLCKEEFVAASNCMEEAMRSGNQEFVAAGDGVEEAMQSENQEFVAAGDGVEEAMQSENQEFVAAGDGVEEPTQSGNQEFVAVGDCMEEVIRSGTQEFVAAGDCMEKAMQEIVAAGDGAEEAMRSGNQGFVAAVDGVEETTQSRNQEFVAAAGGTKEAMQSGDAAEVATASSMTEQGAATLSSMTEQGATASSSMTEQWSHETAALLSFPTMSTAAPFPRQFWKAGEYRVGAQAAINNGQNRLRIHPKFLHSNATSHKWAFGAIAELLDNAVDEVHNGATFVKIDKMKYSPVGEYSLVIQDDGGGMSPESIRHCMSFGFSKKSMISSIGQYGNGFKTSTMRLGADVIVFSCRQDNRRLTRSIGLLSYTFLTRTGCNDILVPVVDYEFDASSCTFKRIMDCGEKHFSSNLSTLLRWSPFPTKGDLLNQFGDMGCHGTKIVVFNLWFNDARKMELDFTTDEEDIMISGAPEIPEERRKVERLNHMHVANRFRYSLRVYASILYLHLPEHFKVILCGQVVEPHHIVNDLIYCECIKYRPQVGVSTEVDVITTIGFLRGAPKLDIFGFNVYHKNRLILPFWPAGSDRRRGRGIAGVLEANFIRPTHDKQDFEKTGLFQRLETRLKEMTLEYWRYHAHLVGYTQIAKTLPPAHYSSVADTSGDSLAARATTKTYVGNSRAKASVVLDLHSNGGNSLDTLHVGASLDQMDYGACSSTRRNTRTSFCMTRNAPLQIQTEPFKRRNSCSVIEWRAQKRQNTSDYANQPGVVNIVEMREESRLIICENKMLKAQCSELEAAEQQLLCKADKLRNELCEWQRVCKGLTDELKFYDGLSALQHDLHRNSSYLGRY